MRISRFASSRSPAFDNFYGQSEAPALDIDCNVLPTTVAIFLRWICHSSHLPGSILFPKAFLFLCPVAPCISGSPLRPVPEPDILLYAPWGAVVRWTTLAKRGAPTEPAGETQVPTVGAASATGYRNRFSGFRKHPLFCLIKKGIKRLRLSSPCRECGAKQTLQAETFYA